MPDRQSTYEPEITILPRALSTTAYPFPTPSTTPTSPPFTATVLATVTDLPAPQVCSPLRDISLSEMNAITSNPYHPPSPGSDDPHQGVDLADRLPDSQVAVTGRIVQAVIAGRVSVIIQDRFPYGNSILIETPLDNLPAGWKDNVQIPTFAPTPIPISPLTCPPLQKNPFHDPSSRSLYLLYAHLLDSPLPLLNDQVECGQAIGLVGESGNALNPHLHFEARVGPAGLQLDSMAHYDPSATMEEMSSYCLWRISGEFQLVDPLRILLSEQP